MTDDSRIHLLLADARTGEAVFGGGIDMAESERGPLPTIGPKPRMLRHKGGDRNDLALQRWGVIAPEGDEGDALLRAVEPLIERRQKQQGGVEVKRYRVPPGADMTLDRAAKWKQKYFNPPGSLESELPLYQLILGDLHQVPLAIQHMQSRDGLVGRLAFDELDGYRAYVEKVQRWEDAPTRHAEGDAILHSVLTDPTTQWGHDRLMAPMFQDLARKRNHGEFRAGELRATGTRNPSPAELWTAAVPERPGVLFTMSHGAGAPPGGWADPDEQRREQGSLCFGPGRVVTGRALANRTFLPGGLWIMFACFGAGTPASSVYRHWLEYLAQVSPRAGVLARHVTESLSPAGRPFVAALPRAALANPDGPLAIIGHVDLAWAYSFKDFGLGDPAPLHRFAEAVKDLLTGGRVGTGFKQLTDYLHSVDSTLVTLYDQDQADEADRRQRRRQNPARANQPARDDPHARARLMRRGQLWMARQDFAGYMLLGDPAVRLPLARNQPERQARPPGFHPLEQLEVAIGKVLSKKFTADDVAYDLDDIDEDELERLVEIYRQGGRAALAKRR